MCREQFEDLWRGTKKPTGEIRLMVAVLMQAIDDLRRFSGGVDGSDAQRFYRRARRWMESNDRGQPFSFMNISEALDMPVVRVRAHLLGGAHGRFDTYVAASNSGSPLRSGAIARAHSELSTSSRPCLKEARSLRRSRTSRTNTRLRGNPIDARFSGFRSTTSTTTRPAAMATNTTGSSRSERTITMVPFMTCSVRVNGMVSPRCVPIFGDGRPRSRLEREAMVAQVARVSTLVRIVVDRASSSSRTLSKAHFAAARAAFSRASISSHAVYPPE